MSGRTTKRNNWRAYLAALLLLALMPPPEVPLSILGSGMKPVLSFKTTVAQVKTLPPNSPIGYGGTYRTRAAETIAIIPVGYADGFRRAPQTWTEVR